MRRKIAIPIDSVLNLFKDYTAGDGSIPADAVPISLQINPAERGMFAVMVESASFRDDTPIRLSFDVKRVFVA